mgnify:CR=1 FL=1
MLERMKADPQLRHLPVIMISAVDEIETLLRCIEAGAEDFLPKPFNPTLLRARIDASLEKKFLRDQERSHLHRIEETQKRLANELQEAARYVVSALPRRCQSHSESPGHTNHPRNWAGILLAIIGSMKTTWQFTFSMCADMASERALLSVAAINVIRSAGLRDTDFLDPGQVLSSLNEAFQMESHNNMFFTIWYGVYDVAARSIRHASGGHPRHSSSNPTPAEPTCSKNFAAPACWSELCQVSVIKSATSLVSLKTRASSSFVTGPMRSVDPMELDSILIATLSPTCLGMGAA